MDILTVPFIKRSTVPKICEFVRYFLGFSIMSTNKNDLSSNSIRWWRERGVVLVTWTVNTQAEKAFFARHGVPVMTDSMVEDVEEQTA